VQESGSWVGMGCIVGGLVTARDDGGRDTPEALERLCKATCEQGPFDGAAIFIWDEGEPTCLAARAGPESLARVRRELRRHRGLRRSLESGELQKREGYALLPMGTKAAFAVWHANGVEPSTFVLHRLSSLASASYEVWRQQALDRTLRRRLHRAQRQLARQEERTERVLRRAAHDLKAPLSAMKGYVDMMLRGMAGPLTPTMQRYTERIRQAIERQRQLIDALLHAPPSMEEPPCLKQILLDALDRSREATDAKRIGLEIMAPAEMCRIRANPAHLELLCRKLVRQVIRSASRGAVVEVELHGEPTGWAIELRAKGSTLDVRGWSLCDAIARRLGGSVDISWQGGMTLLASLPREVGAAKQTGVAAESQMEHVLH